MPTPAYSKEPVWFYPRDTNKDGVCYYIRAGRQTKHWDLKLLQPHPEANSNPVFRDMVFLYRQPFGGKDGTMGDMFQDWYAPRNLIDDVVSVQEVGGGYQTAQLFARGTEPPENDDQRVPVLGQVVRSSLTVVGQWENDPDSASPGVDLMILEGVVPTNFTGDEVYIRWDSIFSGGEDIDGITLGHVAKIVRHVSATQIQIEVPYDVAVSFIGTATVSIYEANYLLQGYSDSESAPGVLANLFNTRTFSYALALPQDTPSYDDELFASVLTEQRLVPQTWQTQWASGYPPAASATASTVIGYSPASVLTANRSKRYLLTEPASLTQINGVNKIQLPRILKSSQSIWVYAYAAKGGQLNYSDSRDVSQDYWGPATMSLPTRTDRHIVLLSGLAAKIASLGTPVNYVPEQMIIPVWWGYYYVGDNLIARANIRNITVGPALADNGSVPIELEAFSTVGGISNAQSSTATGGLKPGGSVNFISENVAWNTTVLWDVSVRQSRWGYWIVEALYVTLPPKPYTV